MLDINKKYKNITGIKKAVLDNRAVFNINRNLLTLFHNNITTIISAIQNRKDLSFIDKLLSKTANEFIGNQRNDFSYFVLICVLNYFNKIYNKKRKQVNEIFEIDVSNLPDDILYYIEHFSIKSYRIDLEIKSLEERQKVEDLMTFFDTMNSSTNYNKSIDREKTKSIVKDIVVGKVLAPSIKATLNTGSSPHVIDYYLENLR
ncbi:MAG: hypothetical protein JJV93_01630 [Alphaproteobacteria bacterium]|nr:hypothetical protein [Alphaproteobacteria bacterium]MBL0717948.1 hypothetical protein [Alphaproteobacteria bacterium]